MIRNRRPAIVTALLLGAACGAGCSVYDGLGSSSAPASSSAGDGAANPGGTGGSSGGAPAAGSTAIDSGAAGFVDSMSDGGVGGASAGTAGSAGVGGTSSTGGSTAGGTGGASGGANSSGGGSGANSGSGGTGGVGTVQLAIGKTAIASTTQTGFDPGKGNDSDLKTRWCASDGTLPQWWRVDLGKSDTLGQVVIHFELAAETYGYLIETSDDDAVYTVQRTLSGTGPIQTSTFPAGVSARYVRITVTAVSNGNWASFYDFALSGN